MGITNALVVDDSRLARLTLTRLLEKRSIQVEKASSAREAFETLKGQHPDLILMDVTMPDIDGLEATRMITNNPETAAIPVVMCTAEDSDEARNKAQACGATAFLTKPAGDDNLDRVLAEISQQLEELEPETEVTPKPGADSEKQAEQTPTFTGANLDLEAIVASAREAARTELRQGAEGVLQELATTAASSAVNSLRAELESNSAQNNDPSDEQDSQQAAHLAAMMTAEESAAETVRQLTEKAVASAVQEQVRAELDKTTSELDVLIRTELTRHLNELLGSEQIRNRLEQAGTRHATSEAERVAGEIAHSMAQSTARETAEEVARSEARKAVSEMKSSQGQKNLAAAGKAKSLAAAALAVSMLALAASAALKFLL